MTCPSGKMSFRSWEKAMIKADSSEWWYGKPFRVYQCRHCRQFHLTTQVKKKDKDLNVSTSDTPLVDSKVSKTHRKANSHGSQA